MPILRKINSKAVIVAPSDSESSSSAHVIRYNGSDMTQRLRLNFSGAGVVVSDDPTNNETDVVITSGGGGSGGTLTGCVLGETMAANVAVYPKLRKKLVIDATNNKLSFAEGGGSYTTVTITNGTYYYPYTSLAADIKAQLEAVGALTYTIISDQQHWKISADNNFKIDKTVANSITTTLGFVSVVTTTGSTYYRADSIHQFTQAVVLLRTNTTSDGSPPYLDDGLFTNLVGATHRSRSFSGFIIAGGNTGDARDLYFSASMSGFSSLVTGSHYYTNGTAGQISTSTVANSLSAGYALNSSTLVIDPGPKDFEFQIEPDTDVSPDTIDDLPAWKYEPELTKAINFDSDLHAFYAAGDYVVTTSADITGGATAFKVSWSVDGGESFKEYGTTFSNNLTISNNSTQYYFVVSKLWCDSTGRVAVLYQYHDGVYYEIKCAYGTIDSNGDLTLTQVNVTNTASAYSVLLHDVAFNNGYLYFLGGDSTGIMNLGSSTDYGATWTIDYVKSGASNCNPFQFGVADDRAPTHLIVINRPGSPANNRLAVVYSANNTAGDPIVTADYHLALAYVDSNTSPGSWATGIDLGDTTGAGNWNIAAGKCWADVAKTKVAFNVVCGHGSGIASGATAPANNPKGFIKLIDLSVATPTQTNSRINYYDDSGTLFMGRAAFNGGFTSENSNGRHFLNSHNNIMWVGNNAFITTVQDTWQNSFNVMHYAPDIVGQNNVSYPVTNPYQLVHVGESARGVGSPYFPSEIQLVESSTDKFAIIKGTESIANNLTGGRVLAQEITYDNSAKSNLVSNSIFTDLTAWTNAIGTGSTAATGGRMRITQNSGPAAAYTTMTTVPGKTYYVKFDGFIGTTTNYGMNAFSYLPSNFNTNGNLFTMAGISANSTGNMISFVAKSTTTYLVANHGGGANATYVEFDNIYCYESDIQFSEAVDLAAKPNVDDEGMAAKIQVLSEPSGPAHVLFKKDWDLNSNGTFYEQPAYQNFKVRVEDVATLWEEIPHEAADNAITSNIEVWDTQFSPNGQYGIACALQTATQNYIFKFSVDYGKTWKIPSTPGTISAGFTAADSDLQTRSPACWVDDSGRVFIGYAKINTGYVVRGLYGTISGNELSLLDTNSATSIFHATNNHRYYIVKYFNSKLYIAARDESTNNMYVAVSSNYGQTFTNGVGAAGTYGNTGLANGGTSNVLIIMPDPDAPSNNRVVVVQNGTSSAPGNYGLYLRWNDGSDLSTGWSGVTFYETGAAARDAIMGWGVSAGYKLCATIYNGAVGLGLGRVLSFDLNLTTPTALAALTTFVNNTQFGLNNGSYDSESIVFRENKVKWTTENSYLIAFEEQTSATHDTGRVCKCSNAASPSGNFTYVSWLTGNASNKAAESQFITVGGITWVVAVTKTVAEASWGANGRIRAVRLLDSSPTTNVAPYMISSSGVDDATGAMTGAVSGLTSSWAGLDNKSSHTNFAGRLRVRQLASGAVAIFEKANSDGFNAIYSNMLMEREIQPLVEEFIKVPLKTSAHGTDVGYFKYDRVGNLIVAGTHPVATSNASSWYSRDGGATWYSSTGLTTGLGGPNNTTDALLEPMAIKINAAGTKFCIMHWKLNGTLYAQSMYGEFDSNGTMINLDTTYLDVFGAANLVTYQLRLKERSGKLYACGLAPGSTKRYMAISANFADTSWGTAVAVKSGGVDSLHNAESPSIFDVVSNGSGGDRAFVIGKKSGSGVTMWYTNDDGVNWQTEIGFGVADSQMFGYGREGNKAVVLLAGNDGASAPNPIYVAYCPDLTVTTPSWTVQSVSLTGMIGIGQAGQEGPNLTLAQTDKAYGHVYCLNRVIFTSATSFICGFDVRHSGGVEVPCLLKFHDVTNLANYQYGYMENASGVQKFEAQLVKSSGGRMFIIYRLGDSASFNLTSGRLVAREIYDPTPTTNVLPGYDGVQGDTNYIDLAYKTSATTGGFAGRMQVVGDSIMFEKEDGSGFEQIYFQSLTAKQNGKVV